MAKLPAGHISTEDAIRLINKHTAEKPLVDIKFLIRNIGYKRLQAAHNFTIKLMQKDSNGKYYSGLHVVAVVANTRDKENLKYAIMEKYKEIHGRAADIEHMGIKKMTTQVDDLNGSTERARMNKAEKPKTKRAAKAKAPVDEPVSEPVASVDIPDVISSPIDTKE